MFRFRAGFVGTKMDRCLEYPPGFDAGFSSFSSFVFDLTHIARRRERRPPDYLVYLVVFLCLLARRVGFYKLPSWVSWLACDQGESGA